MSATNTWRARLVTFCAAAAALIVTAAGAAANTGVGAKSASSSPAPVVKIETGPVRGSPGGWWLRLPRVAVRRRPHRAAEMAARSSPPTGTVSATRPSSHRAARSRWSATPFFARSDRRGLPVLNVSTPSLHSRRGDGRPVLVWIHGRSTQDAARNYDGSKLAAEGTVVVTINYRLGVSLLAHLLALAAGRLNRQLRLDGPAGSLRWIQRNIAQFGGDPDNVTIAGQSAGGLSVLAHLVSRDRAGSSSGRSCRAAPSR